MGPVYIDRRILPQIGRKESDFPFRHIGSDTMNSKFTIDAIAMPRIFTTGSGAEGTFYPCGTYIGERINLNPGEDHYVLPKVRKRVCGES